MSLFCSFPVSVFLIPTFTLSSKKRLLTSLLPQTKNMHVPLLFIVIPCNLRSHKYGQHVWSIDDIDGSLTALIFLAIHLDQFRKSFSKTK